ncbi:MULTISPECIES: heavy metal translocating P-type ATPase [Cupriavidus]|jgi:Zn2+/Cd2+-exporting ATPase|uniref:P-type Zn(2+) transporter n=3 Tax=Cupriavidus TaxID=106589 RepID=Q58AJ6_CUPMC|nr:MULTISPECIES: heavy metal translocating P-type ATPase [Cupriavidus]PCH57274.1 MAG: copper-translocating P-type ATPase [Burkholderiaceae bacterium]WNN27049.1 P-type ATPase [Paenibacillus dendritiformis]ABF12806.1 P-type ATPase involved in Pb(II) resistance PbrA [Cupriavidus metallidurans CH34]AOY97438.1 copper-translocating P-type ATPase [Cupriavidus sp. USMAA2-4]AVA34458.1 copper-translocating P-type ATPase [Cupriavidus metallidurans]
MSECGSKGCGCASVATRNPEPSTVGAGLKQARYRIENMDCPTEEALIRDKLAKLPGVGGLEFNLMQRTLAVSHQMASPGPIEEALSAIGMRAVRMDEATPLQNTVLAIHQMDCPTEEALIRSKLAGIPGVASLEFNLVQRTLHVWHAADTLSHVLTALKSLGFDAEVRSAGAPAAAEAPGPARTNWWPLAVSGVAATLAEVVYWLHGGNHWGVVALALAAIFTGGLTTYKRGWIALRNRNLNMNALMSIAVTGAMLIGHWPEAAMVMVLFALAEVIEAKSLDRARNAIRGLMDLAPDTALIQQADGSWAEVDAKAVAVGSRIRVKPGERIALDGQVIEGRSTVNQAPITGESLPVEKIEGDPVFAGTINESGSFEFRVTAAANASTLARIIHAVEAAQGSRAPTQRFVDQFARLYTPVVFAVALAVAVLPPLVFGGPWLDWIYKALVLLVIACPCALVISTPVSIVSGLAAAARHGILIKGGVYLEEGRKLKWLALDKTGTITHGKPALTDFVVWGDANPATSRLLAASLAARSDHPVSLAVARAAEGEGLIPCDVADFAALPGRGVRGSVDDHSYHLGNHRLVEELGVCSPELESRLAALEAEGKTVVMLVGPEGVQALFAVADTVKENSRQAIADLHTLGVKTMMLTGDNPHTATAIAGQVGIDRSRGNLLPEDKLREVEQLSTDGKTGMVGDGINDAPALARADIGFAMGAAGTDTAIETADVALMDDDLRKLPTFVRLSRATASVLKQNIALALGIKAVFLVLTFTGQATMWMAVFADMGASLLVVGNGLRLLRR